MFQLTRNQSRLAGLKGEETIQSTCYSQKAKGYVLFDVMLALFLFSLGFGVLFELTTAALSESGQATSLMEGANLAQETMDKLAANGWVENIANGDCIPGGVVTGTYGKFHWHVFSEWRDLPQLLKVSIKVSWTERGISYQYMLESLYAAE